MLAYIDVYGALSVNHRWMLIVKDLFVAIISSGS